MRRMLMAGGALAAALAVTGMVMACDSGQATSAAAEGVTCTRSMAEAVYAKTLAATGCERTARQAAYDAVLQATGCAKTAESATRQAAMTSTGEADRGSCAKGAAAKAAGMTTAGTSSCPYEAAEGSAPSAKSCAKDGAPVAASDGGVVYAGASCPVGHSKAADDATLKTSGCEGSTRESAAETLAVDTYTKAKSETGCAKTARRAAYDAVLAATGCAKTAEGAARVAAAKAVYEETLKATGCAETAQKEYDKVAKSGEPVQVAEAAVGQ